MKYGTNATCGVPRPGDMVAKVTFCEGNSPKLYSYLTGSHRVAVGAYAVVNVGGKPKQVKIRQIRAAEPDDCFKRLVSVEGTVEQVMFDALAPKDKITLEIKADSNKVDTKKLGETFHERMQMMIDADLHKMMTGKDDRPDAIDTQWRTTHLKFAGTVTGRMQSNPEFQQLPQENTMKIEITRATYVNGRNIKEVLDDDLLMMLKGIDKEIEKLSTLDPIPGRFQRKIEELTQSKADLLALLEEVDNDGQKA